MFKRFFKPKWQHQDLPVRQQALAAFDAENDAEIIIKMAREDPSDELRLQALSRITNQKALQSMLAEAENPEEWCVIAVRLNKLLTKDIEQSAKGGQSAQHENLINSFTGVKDKWDKEDTFRAIAGCQDIELANSLLMSTKEPAALLKVATSASSIELRLKAVAEIQDPEVLQVLSKQATHKKVLQLVRKRMNQAREAQKKVIDTCEQAHRLCQAMNKLNAQTWLDTQFEIKVNSLVSQWQQLDQSVLQDSSKDKLEEFQVALDGCKKIIAANRKELEKAALEQEAADKQQGLCAQLQDLLDELNNQEMLTLESFQSVRDAWTFLESSWYQIADEVKPNQKTDNRYNSLRKKLEDGISVWEKFADLEPEFVAHFESSPENDYGELSIWLKSWKKLASSLQWPKGMAQPALLLEWRKNASEYQTRFDKLHAAQKKKAGYLNQKLAILQKHLRERNLIAANKLSNYINLQLDTCVEDFRNTIVRRLEVIQPQLDELRDWHAFATTPKKHDLCESMERLIKASIEPLARAKQVRELQEQWRELIASDADADQALWDRFKQASDEAYQPCLEFYAEQDKIKMQNLQQRIQICETLEKMVVEHNSNSVDWKNADWKNMDKTFTRINRDWKNHQPVPENERRSVQKRFTKVSNVIRDHLNKEKERNLEQRCELVEKANKLIGLDELEKSIEGAIRLQAQWKELGITFFKADREQWRLFRKAIDQVFDRRKALKQSHQQELQDNQNLLVDITQQINALCELEDSELKQSYEQFEAIQQSWDPELELPRSASRKILKDFEAASQKYLSHYSGLDQRLQKVALDSFMRTLNLLERAEEALLEGSSVDKELLQHQVADCACSESDKKLLQSRLQNILTTEKAEENSAGLRQLRELALKAEILVGIESPESYKAERMATQLEQLKQGLGTSVSSSDKQAEIMEILKIWATIGFIAKTDRLELEERKARCFAEIT